MLWGLLGPQRSKIVHIFVIGWLHLPLFFLISSHISCGFVIRRTHWHLGSEKTPQPVSCWFFDHPLGRVRYPLHGKILWNSYTFLYEHANRILESDTLNTLPPFLGQWRGKVHTCSCQPGTSILWHIVFVYGNFPGVTETYVILTHRSQHCSSGYLYEHISQISFGLC